MRRFAPKIRRELGICKWGEGLFEVVICTSSTFMYPFGGKIEERSGRINNLLETDLFVAGVKCLCPDAAYPETANPTTPV
jgi:hypothetical protein